MTFTRDKQKITLAVLIAVIVLLNIYYALNREKPKTAPLTYAPGAVATSPVRVSARAGAADPLHVFLERREEKYPGVIRDIFRMENPAPKVKPVPRASVVALPTPTVPPVPEKTPEQIAAEAAAEAARVAAEAARADLQRFRFLGYLTDKDNTLFLSKDGELIMVKSGGALMKSYRIKESTKDYVILYDTITHVEVRVDLSGSEQAPQQPAVPQMPPAWRRSP